MPKSTTRIANQTTTPKRMPNIVSTPDSMELAAGRRCKHRCLRLFSEEEPERSMERKDFQQYSPAERGVSGLDRVVRRIERMLMFWQTHALSQSPQRPIRARIPAGSDRYPLRAIHRAMHCLLEI